MEMDILKNKTIVKNQVYTKATNKYASNFYNRVALKHEAQVGPL
jgi:hypothetical protein